MTPTIAWWSLAALALGSLLFLVGLALYWHARGDAFFGPLFTHETVLLVRRNSHIILRTLYPTALLILLGLIFLIRTQYLGYSVWERLSQPVVPTTTMAEFSLGFFLLFAVIQFIFLYAMTLQISAASVAEDREAKRLDFLLSTPLENHEIVLGKITARMATIFLLALSAVPIFSLLPFFGGVDPQLILGVALFTLLTLLGLAALGCACSVWASTTTHAGGNVYLFVIGYHMLSGMPYALASDCPCTPPWLLDAFSVLNSGNIVAQVVEIIRDIHRGEPLNEVMPQALFRYAVFQTLVIGLCGWLAIWRLRAAHRKTNEGIVDPGSVPPAELKYVVIVDRPPVSDRPLLWKALYVEDDMQPRHGQRILFRLGKQVEPARARLHARIFFVLSMFAPLGAIYALAWWFNEPPVDMWNVVFRGISAMVGVFGWIRMTSQATTTMAGEREQRTLPDLLLTELDRREILAQKLLGCLHRGLWPMVWITGFGILNAVVGSLHILSLVLFLVLWMLYAVFFVSLAFWYSTISPTKTVAARRLLITLAVIGIGCSVIHSPVSQTRYADGMMASVVPPLPLALAGMTPAQLDAATRTEYQTLFAAGVSCGLMLTSIVTAILWRATIKRFERETAETIMSR